MRTDINVYEACDKAIKALDRLIVEAFGRLKTAKWDRVNLIKTVLAVYESIVKRAKKRYREVGFEAYLLGLFMCGIDGRKAHEMAEKAITTDWVDDILFQTDYVTLYRFDSETERKAYRLAEALEATEDRSHEIDKAMRAWSKQVGQYAINVTDYAIAQAFEDAGVKVVQWVAEHDDRTCNECRALDGQQFRIDEVPAKRHLNCRCKLVPVFREMDG